LKIFALHIILYTGGLPVVGTGTGKPEGTNFVPAALPGPVERVRVNHGYGYG
jgi:hypothetical protein